MRHEAGSMKPIVITDIPLGVMPDLAKEFGLKKYAANQIIHWLYRERAASFDEMTNIPKIARATLSEKFAVNAVSTDSIQTASDGTRKYLCRATDSAAVECVFIPSTDGRNTVCISTQAGCAMGCVFCRTGQAGFRRNLTQGEIVGQLILVMRDRDEPVTNVVLMGMGEPLMNLAAVSNAVEIFLDPRAFGLIAMTKETFSKVSGFLHQRPVSSGPFFRHVKNRVKHKTGRGVLSEIFSVFGYGIEI